MKQKILMIAGWLDQAIEVALMYLVAKQFLQGDLLGGMFSLLVLGVWSISCTIGEIRENGITIKRERKE